MAMRLSECYRILRVDPHRKWKEVKQSYHFLARRYHPDIRPNNPSSEAQFRKITQAFRMLETHYKIRTETKRKLVPNSAAEPSGNVKPATRAEPVMAEPLGKFPTRLHNAQNGNSIGNQKVRNWLTGFREQFFDLEKKLFVMDLKKNVYIKDRLTARSNLIRVKKGGEHFQVKIPPGPWTRMFIRIPGKGEKSLISNRRGDLVLNIHVPNREQVEPPDPVFYYKVKVPKKSVAASKVFTLNSSQGSINFNLPKTAEDGQEFVIKSNADEPASSSTRHVITVKLV